MIHIRKGQSIASQSNSKLPFPFLSAAAFPFFSATAFPFLSKVTHFFFAGLVAFCMMALLAPIYSLANTEKLAEANRPRTEELIAHELDLELQKAFPDLQNFTEAQRLSVFVFYIISQASSQNGILEVHFTEAQIQAFREGRNPLSETETRQLQQNIAAHFSHVTQSFRSQLELLKPPPSLMRKLTFEVVRSLIAAGVSFVGTLAISKGWIMNLDSSVEIVRTVSFLSALYWVTLPLRTVKILQKEGESTQRREEAINKLTNLPTISQDMVKAWFLMTTLRDHLIPGLANGPSCRSLLSL